LNVNDLTLLIRDFWIFPETSNNLTFSYYALYLYIFLKRRLIMRSYLIFIITLSGWAHILSINVPAPEYQILDGKILVEHGSYINPPGAPNLPCRNLTIALPPGAIVEHVNCSGSREELTSISVLPAPPILPMINDNSIKTILKSYRKQYEQFYSSTQLYPETFGALLSKGGLRKYTLINVACYHFAYKPVLKKLYYTPFINVEVHYIMPAPNSERAKFCQKLINDITFDEIAKDAIYNWDDVQTWYHTDTPHRADGYYNDLPQKIRNYLRDNMADIEFALLVGFSTDIPWRSVVPFNNNPYSPWGNPDYSPIPCDLYYAELTDPDSLSWNSDGDNYYGEVWDDNFQPVGEDNPDYHADIHLGRIPYSTQGAIEEICEKMIAFDNNTDLSYKTASLLAGAIYYYENENNTGNSRMDGADFTEELMNDSVLDRANAVYLYEKAGLRPCPYTCTDSLTKNNMISYWQNKGIMYECHHGGNYAYARKIWAWDDGDSIPENNEIQWPMCLQTSDVNQLDNNHPATTFLRSCLCGNPDVNGLGAQLLHHGSSAVISSSRVAWMTYSDPGGMPYHFFDRLMNDTTLSNGIIGTAYDIARNDFMDATSFWLPAYHYNLFGDPALRQYGRLTSITIQLHSSQKRKIELDVYDESGRFVQHLYKGYIQEQTRTMNTKLPAGVYFLRLRDEVNTEFKKLVIVE
jgi:hypothetical protein